MANNIIVASTSVPIAEYIRKNIEQLTRNEPVLLASGLEDLKEKIKRFQARLVFLESNFADIATPYLMAVLKGKSERARFAIFSFEKAVCQEVERFYNLGAAGYLNYRDGPEACLKGCRKLLEGKEYFPEEIAETGALQHFSDYRLGELKQQGLTMQDRELMCLLSRGKTAGEIGGLLHLTYETVKNYKSRIYKKCGIKNAVQLLLFALYMGYVSLEEVLKAAFGEGGNMMDTGVYGDSEE
ncbi:transcriptional regulator, LuxR family protein [Treponema primitia ZAS-2]|uniref:Transcriptional regulator, LuxR family protein n=1 Tax=Treponema primitia (strain ATCC BAA-887 / DSM 12427 / ZAS-2) TaxID=545694 RepID=F5YJW5_TREPZ|nr:LuxR C-terminal-related transcriptional regulator [Treponema primitia]AEF85439.1 transcriptional regulator, LuxR family protein [Treponema primitia ZAS-2]